VSKAAAAAVAVAEAPPAKLLAIGEAARCAGVSERALRYYQELGLITPSGCSPGGARRYSEADLERVARIREFQTLLGLNLDEIAVVLHNEDRMAEIRAAYHSQEVGGQERRALLVEGLALQEELRSTVMAKRNALDGFLADLNTRIGRIRDLITEE
jgi:DNA-binding transcriptional MerR regulator